MINKRKTQIAKLKTRGGFTLLETIVAVAILMVAIGSAFGLAPEGLVGARFAKNQTTATYLAQEVLESIHNARDNAMYFSPSEDPLNWLSGFAQCIGVKCTINAIDLVFTPCSATCPPLKAVTTSDGGSAYGNGGFFDSDPSVVSTIFTRSVTVQKVQNTTIGRDDTEALVTVSVTWKEGSVTKDTRIEDTIFDWWTYNK